MGAEDILKLVRDRPFRPFRIIMVSGKTYEVHHPELVSVGYVTTIFYHKKDLDKPWQGFDLLGTPLIERIEFTETPKAAVA